MSLTATAQGPPGGAYEGRPVAEALERLQKQGLRIVFSNALVPPELTVETEPAVEDPRGVLGEILAPHGLAVQEGPGGVLVVVAADAPEVRRRTGIQGEVRSRQGGRSLAGVTVVALEAGAETVTGVGGRFQLLSLPAGSYTVEARIPGFIVEQRESVAVAPGRATELDFDLLPVPVPHDEIDVVPSRYSLLDPSPVNPLALSRQEVLRLPHLGDDVFRALTLLPGTAGNDLSARFSIRGGRRDEVQVLLDGQELYDAFHLKDFDGALSVVSSGALQSADLLTGGFQAEFGDRMSGVLDMATLRPSRRRSHLGLSLLAGQAGTSGVFDGDRGHWMALLRSGTGQLAGEVLNEDTPDYWDVYGKVDLSLRPRHRLRVNVLGTGDDYRLQEFGEESKDLNTDDSSLYLWAGHQALLSPRVVVETTVARTRQDRDRRGREIEEEVTLEIRDLRETETTEVRQRWDAEAGSRHTLRWGFSLRRFETEYDFFRSLEFDTVLAKIRGEEPDGETVFFGEATSDLESVYLVDRLRLRDRLTAEVGLRYDHASPTGDEDLSPRLNLAWSVGEGTVLRAAWGHVYQSHRTYELLVEEADGRFYPSERAEHRILGVEHLFRRSGGTGGLVARLEVYRRWVENPRPRIDNLFEPVNTFQELEPDRIRLTPSEVSSEGAELFLRLLGGKRFTGWLSYAWAEVEDVLDGAEVPRLLDQTHTITWHAGYRFGPRWSLDLAWRYHSGRPTTEVSLIEVPGEEEDDPEHALDDEDEDEDTEIVPVLGPLNARRLPEYHRLDLRLNRRVPTRRGSFTFFLDIQNVYNRSNAEGLDLEVEEDTLEVIVTEEEGLAFTPSIGFRWEF